MERRTSRSTMRRLRPGMNIRARTDTVHTHGLARRTARIAFARPQVAQNLV